MFQVTNNNLQETELQRKVKEQIEWIAQCRVHAILITCTNYVSHFTGRPTFNISAHH